jgi:hypothetical protein
VLGSLRLNFGAGLDFAMRLELSMSDKSRQMDTGMYYFAPRSCAILIDSKIVFAYASR